MTILLIEHRVDDFERWKADFDTDPLDRSAHGVTRHWIHRDADDPKHHLVGMEFATPEAARAFRDALAAVWERSAAGQTWILEPTESLGPAGGGASTTVNRFVFKLIPPRTTFPADMSAEESAIMAQHFAYWEGFEQRGQVVVLGPVLDPAGAWGLGVIEGDTEDDVRAIALGDPAVASGMATFELLPMGNPFVRS